MGGGGGFFLEISTIYRKNIEKFSHTKAQIGILKNARFLSTQKLHHLLPRRTINIQTIHHHNPMLLPIQSGHHRRLPIIPTEKFIRQ